MELPQQHLSVARSGLFIRPRLASWPVVVSGEGVPGLSQGRFRHVGVSVWESSVSVLALQFAFRFGITKELLLCGMSAHAPIAACRTQEQQNAVATLQDRAEEAGST